MCIVRALSVSEQNPSFSPKRWMEEPRADKGKRKRQYFCTAFKKDPLLIQRLPDY
jgi:hypothetical protein